MNYFIVETVAENGNYIYTICRNEKELNDFKDTIEILGATKNKHFVVSEAYSIKSFVSFYKKAK